MASKSEKHIGHDALLDLRHDLTTIRNTAVLILDRLTCEHGDVILQQQACRAIIEQTLQLEVTLDRLASQSRDWLVAGAEIAERRASGDDTAVHALGVIGLLIRQAAARRRWQPHAGVAAVGQPRSPVQRRRWHVRREAMSMPAAGETMAVADAARVLVTCIEDAAADRYESVPSRIRHAARDLGVALAATEHTNALPHRPG